MNSGAGMLVVFSIGVWMPFCTSVRSVLLTISSNLLFSISSMSESVTRMSAGLVDVTKTLNRAVALMSVLCTVTYVKLISDENPGGACVWFILYVSSGTGNMLIWPLFGVPSLSFGSPSVTSSEPVPVNGSGNILYCVG